MPKIGQGSGRGWDGFWWCWWEEEILSAGRFETEETFISLDTALKVGITTLTSSEHWPGSARDNIKNVTSSISLHLFKKTNRLKTLLHDFSYSYGELNYCNWPQAPDLNLSPSTC